MTAIKLHQLDWDASRQTDEEIHFSLVSGFGDQADMDAAYLSAFADGLYVHVADFTGGDLDHLWTATNNGVLSDSWSLIPPDGVVPTEPSGVLGEDGETYGRRSTSVGDIAEVDGRLHVVAPIGWRDLGPVPVQAAGPKS